MYIISRNEQNSYNHFQSDQSFPWFWYEKMEYDYSDGQIWYVSAEKKVETKHLETGSWDGIL